MTKFLTIEQVIELHDAFLEDHGGLAGIRDRGLLSSAVETPRSTMFGEFLHKTIYDQAAAYLFHLVQNHPFNDGNKRTGALTAILFLELNGIEVTFPEDEYENLVVNVAQGKKTQKPKSPISWRMVRYSRLLSSVREFMTRRRRYTESFIDGGRDGVSV